MGKKRVQTWRIRKKATSVGGFGGVCGYCGNKYPDIVFDFHHLSPSTKIDTISNMLKNPTSKIIAELKKCVMLCANCHRLVESSHIELDEHIKRYDEKLAEETERTFKTGSCANCNKPIWVHNKVCNQSCGAEWQAKQGKKSNYFPWEDYDLEKLLKDNSHNFSAIGRLLGVSDNAVRKRAIKVGLK